MLTLCCARLCEWYAKEHKQKQQNVMIYVLLSRELIITAKIYMVVIYLELVYTYINPVYKPHHKQRAACQSTGKINIFPVETKLKTTSCCIKLSIYIKRKFYVIENRGVFFSLYLLHIDVAQYIF